MLTMLRKRLTYTNIMLTLALLFAMTGGAYAASKVLITSTKQISPKVLASLKGAKGATGANGAPGTPGTQGPQGAAGTAGATGAKGTNGIDGKEGPQGKEGQAGEEGQQGPVGPAGPTCPNGKCLLPEGATETGVWSFRDKGPSAAFVSISFPLRLSGSPTLHFVKWSEEGTAKAPKECPSDFPSKPEALPGNLCVYEGEPISEGELVNAEIPTMVTGEADGTSGLVLNFTFTNPANEAQGSGTWAVAR